MNFEKKLRRIKKKLHAGDPVKKKGLLMPIWLFDDTKLVVIRLHFPPKNEKFSKRFISKLQTFTNGKVRYHIIWNAYKIQFLFNNKDKVLHLSCVIYKSVCSCGADYVGETIRNVKIRWNERESRIDKNSECL